MVRYTTLYLLSGVLPVGSVLQITLSKYILQFYSFSLFVSHSPM